MEKEQKVIPNDHLANERTFLAWLRTSIAIMGLGFVVVKFSLFIKQLSLALGEQPISSGKGYSSIIGTILVATGALIALLAWIRYKKIQQKLLSNQYYPSATLSTLLTLGILLFSIILVIYLLAYR